ncbi:hypothetical protein CDAR_125981 [Caerostris darwini]|uniref:Uncharacterized protein n=1 Tax=Caerostris darwini TaxID=1538125 RepID=A0AAV4S9Z5_9ARAC|nr:hypothetical protein CDAR_125981 [Caerostris darwini]
MACKNVFHLQTERASGRVDTPPRPSVPSMEPADELPFIAFWYAVSTGDRGLRYDMKEKKIPHSYRKTAQLPWLQKGEEVLPLSK